MPRFYIASLKMRTRPSSMENNFEIKLPIRVSPLRVCCESIIAPKAQHLPRSLFEAMGFLRDSTMFRQKLGDVFVDYMLSIKEFEFNRFMSEVTDWEHREYFSLF